MRGQKTIFTCSNCGICADSAHCVSGANLRLPCKAITTKTATHKHHWVQGKLNVKGQCEVCEKECGKEHTDWWCCWCHLCVHHACQPNMAEVCDIGKFKNYTVPPNCIQLSSSKIKRGFLAAKVLEPNVGHWSPVLILGNKKSGSQESNALLTSFRKILNPAQVVELTEIPPEEALEWCRLVPNHVTCRVVAAGGDGTVCWVMNAIHKMKFERVPEVAILPVGTGNDLSSALGFGWKLRRNFKAAKYLDQLDKATPAKLDRWQIQYFPPRHLLVHASEVDLHMNNYVSMGIDALVSLKFHRARESPSYIFNNRHFNKLMYFMYAVKTAIMQNCKNI
ncbi:hypothetical protein Pcinc_034294 [Petrolisthes cinctipes]|uniref:diacylglycerol kinase (ATP) n=1 Tax=Petrolisthes cinctipes TaxID=88211 RepID=A0AAE1EQI8_PETCI|nr:hypothetical protein Pcinc_034294 [Petrolisthes cinctipes]